MLAVVNVLRAILAGKVGDASPADKLETSVDACLTNAQSYRNLSRVRRERSEIVRQEFMGAGAADVVMKPVALQTLCSIRDRCLARSLRPILAP